jgi:hypothetical protein
MSLATEARCEEILGIAAKKYFSPITSRFAISNPHLAFYYPLINLLISHFIVEE